MFSSFVLQRGHSKRVGAGKPNAPCPVPLTLQSKRSLVLCGHHRSTTSIIPLPKRLVVALLVLYATEISKIPQGLQVARYRYANPLAEHGRKYFLDSVFVAVVPP